MIHHVFYRTQPKPDPRGKEVCLDRQLTPAEALKYLIKAELAYGSTVVVKSPTHIQSESRSFGQLDEMDFTGTVEEMAHLVQLCSAYNEVKAMPIETHFPRRGLGGLEFSNDAADYLTKLYRGKSALTVVLNALVLSKAPGADLSKANQLEVVELYLSLCDGSLTPEEVCEIFV